MAGNVQELRPGRAGDSEKITINLGYVDLGHIDLMVAEGFYANRTDFIRTAIRNQLDRHGEAAKQSVAGKGLELGLLHYTRQDLEAARAAGEMLHVRVLGLASIAADVTPELARATIASVTVLGRFTPARRSRPPWPTASGDPGGPSRRDTTTAFDPRRGSPVRLATPTHALPQPGCLP